MNEGRTKVEQTIELLCREFPRCFVMFERQRRPLKVGIVEDIRFPPARAALLD